VDMSDAIKNYRNMVDQPWGRMFYEWLIKLLEEKMDLVDTYAIRTFFGLSSNNDIKYTGDWYQSMLELETKACSIDEYKKVSFFNHLIFKKRF